MLKISLLKKLTCILILIFLFVILIKIHAFVNESSEPVFSINGEKHILKDMNINIEIYGDGNISLKTLLSKGKKYLITPGYVDIYSFYVYSNGKVYFYQTDNFARLINNSNDRINHVEVYEKQNSIYIKYYTRNSEIEKNIGLEMKIETPINDYINQQIPDVTKTKEREELRQKFLGLYE